MSDSLAIETSGPLDAVVRPPGSKSITNRALVCAALADGQSTLRGVLTSDDTGVMIEALRALGGPGSIVESNDDLIVHGTNGQFANRDADLWVGNSGTTVRFLAAMLSAGVGRFRLDGVPRMRQRPIEDLVTALQQFGTDIRSELNNGCPPVVIRASGLRGGTARVRGDVSSQFLSGLLMAAPYAKSGVELHVDGELVSKPYVTMTIAVMKSFGVDVQQKGWDQFVIRAPRSYRGCDYEVEPDASAASYFWAAAAIAGGSVTVNGLSRSSLQGDIGFVDCLASMGCQLTERANSITVAGPVLRGIDVNMNAISDTVQTLAAVALFAQGPTTIRGVGHIRHKETDRIGDLARELRKLGATVDEHFDGLTITPGTLQAAEIATYDDHRMAMSLALVGLRQPGVVILNPECTRKTYPNFFRDLATLRSTLSTRGGGERPG